MISSETTAWMAPLLLAAGSVVGKWVFVGLFALVAVALFMIPRRWIDQEQLPPWWRNVRFWAVFVAVTQMMIYAVWG